MTRAHIFRFLPLAILALLAASCAVPLGPGFHTEKELLEVRFVPGAPPHFELRATFTLKNSGNVPLDGIDVVLPDEQIFGPADFHIQVDGRAVSSQASAADGAVTIPFSAPWPQKSQHTIVISYNFTNTSGPGGSFGIGDNSFFLSSEVWYPLPRAPKGLFAKGNTPPGRFDLSVIVPQDFLVLAAGHPRGKKRRAAESEFRFRIAPDDFSPFIVAGRYHEQKFSAANSAILFWTLQPLPADQVARAGPRLAASAQILEKLFGPIQAGKRSSPLWIIETLNKSVPFIRGGRVVQVSAAPGVALLSSSAFSDGVASSYFLENVEGAWSYIWPSFVAEVAPGADELLLSALAECANLKVDEARRGESARSNYAVGFLNQIDAAPRGTIEISISAATQNDFSFQYRNAEARAALLLLAAEDKVGSEIFHRALRRMIQGLRGRTYGFTDLRVALEAESGEDLGDFFRLWLNHPSIPADFRARYASH